MAMFLLGTNLWGHLEQNYTTKDMTVIIRGSGGMAKPIITGADVITLQALEQFELYTGVRLDEKLMMEASQFSRS